MRVDSAPPPEPLPPSTASLDRLRPTTREAENPVSPSSTEPDPEVSFAGSDCPSHEDILARSPSLEGELREARASPSRRLGRYLLLSELGRGGYGCVFRAWDTTLERLVALKLLTRLGSDRARRRFLREAKATAAVEHPAVVALYDVGEHRGLPYLVMEYVEGRTLKDFAAESAGRPGAARVATAVALLRQVAEATAAAHARGLLHRDLKPSNVLVTPGGKARVLDFGLVHSTAARLRLTRSGAALGTPLFMAPEQARGEPPAPTLDVFGLGATLYYALTGRPPYEADTWQGILEAHARGLPAPPSAYEPAVPPALEDLVLRCLANDPRQRPQSAAEVARTLEAAQHVCANRGASPRARLAFALAGFAGVLVLAGLLGHVLFVRNPGVAVDGGDAAASPAQSNQRGNARRAPEGAAAEELGSPRDGESVAVRSRKRAVPSERGSGESPPAADAGREGAAAEGKAQARADRALARARAALAGGDPRRAVAECDACLALRPDDVSARAIRGVARARSGDWLGAERDLSAALRVDPHDAYSLRNRAAVRIALRRLDGAEADLQAAFALGVVSPSLLHLKARLHGARGDLAGALTLMDRAVADAPRDVGFLSFRARLLTGLKRHREAASCLTQAIAASPRPDANLFGRRGDALLRAGERQAAAADYAAAARIDPRLARAWLSLARVRRGLGDREGARLAYRRYLGLRPRDAAVAAEAERLERHGGE